MLKNKNLLIIYIIELVFFSLYYLYRNAKNSNWLFGIGMLLLLYTIYMNFREKEDAINISKLYYEAFQSDIGKHIRLPNLSTLNSSEKYKGFEFEVLESNDGSKTLVPFYLLRTDGFFDLLVLNSKHKSFDDVIVTYITSALETRSVGVLRNYVKNSIKNVSTQQAINILKKEGVINKDKDFLSDYNKNKKEND